MVTNRMGRKTAPGFADPHAPVVMPAPSAEQTPAEPPTCAVATSAAPQPEARRSSETQRPKQTPLVEIEVNHERGSAPRAESVRRVFEIWTYNNVYALDARMRCIEVRSTTTSKAVADHPFLGTRLVGGQAQSEQAVEMSYPMPRPGAFAVFEGRRGNRRQFSRTSPVVRVVLRLHIVTVTDPTAIPTWEEVSGES